MSETAQHRPTLVLGRPARDFARITAATAVRTPGQPEPGGPR